MNAAANFTRSHSTHCPLTLLPVFIVAGYYFLVTSFILIGSSSGLTFAQTNGPPSTTTEQFPASSLASLLQTTTTSTRPTLATNSTTNVQQQPISFKFTLIAGKLWKFKTNSFASHKEGELRLHKNVSLNNYIIDDEGWFQYNPQHQQLFAWPSLTTKPGTYQFVLIPSHVDFEANSENNVAASLDVVATIVVELIRPLYLGTKSEIDQYIDHKFSLEYLHRHASYPLLLHEIVSVFDTISSKSSNISTITQQQKGNISTLPTVLAQQQKGLRLTNKLGEYILISLTYSSDGDLFSLTWSTHPALATNNTITPINECRIATINETVSRLSSLSSGYRSLDEKFIVYYPLNASFVNSQAIVSTERGNHTLRLNLNGPCQKISIIEELGIVSANNGNNELVADVNDDKDDDKIADSSSSSNKQQQQTPTLTIQPKSVSSVPGLPNPEAIGDADTVVQTTQPPSSTSTPSIAAESSPSTINLSPTLVTNQTPAPLNVNDQNSQRPPPPTNLTTQSPEPTDVALSELTPTLNPTESKVNNRTIVEAQVFKSEGQLVFQQPQPKSPPQAKSFADFLEPDVPLPISTMPATTMTTNITSTDAPQILRNFSRSLNNITLNDSISFNTKDASQAPESTLNEDFMGIVNEVMDYLLSVAVPISIIVGTVLLVSITIALCNLCVKKRKSKQFQVKNRFSFRYGSERKAFLKNSSKPVILDADQKSISMGGTPQHQFAKRNSKPKQTNDKRTSDATSYFPLYLFSSSGNGQCNVDGGNNNRNVETGVGSSDCNVGGDDTGGSNDCS